MTQKRRIKNRKTAILLACLPWGIFTWLYTYEKDKKKFFRNIRSVITWLILTLLILILPDVDSIKEWLADRSLETELTQLVLLICVAAILALVVLEGWIKSLRYALRRSEDWYRKYPKNK